MSIEIRKVESKKELRKFVKFYISLYQWCKYAPLPLNIHEIATLTKKNPASEHCESACWMAFEDGFPVGRIAAIINRHECKKLNKLIGRFGWFDFVDNTKVSKALMDTAIEWFRKRNIEMIHGPMGFTDMERQGLLLEGFGDLGTFAANYNHSYYKNHFELMEFEKLSDWVEYELDVKKVPLEHFEALAKRVRDTYGFRSLELTSQKELKKYVSEVFKLLNISYRELYGVIELTDKQIKYYADMFLDLMDPTLICIVVDKNNKLVGFGITMMSLTEASQRSKGKLFPLGWYHFKKASQKNKILDFYLIAVAPEHRNKGVNALMMEKISRRAIELGVRWAETNIELEDNKNVRSMWRFFETRQHKRRRSYMKKLR